MLTGRESAVAVRACFDFSAGPPARRVGRLHLPESTALSARLLETIATIITVRTELVLVALQRLRPTTQEVGSRVWSCRVQSTSLQLASVWGDILAAVPQRFALQKPGPRQRGGPNSSPRRPAVAQPFTPLFQPILDGRDRPAQ